MSEVLVMTHTDLDGYSADILCYAFGFDATVVHLDNHVVDDYVIELIRRIENGERTRPESIIVTDLGLKERTAKIVNNWITRLPRANRPFFQLLDHHPTALHLNQYDWARVVVKEQAPKACGASLLFEYLYHQVGFTVVNGSLPKLQLLVEEIRLYDNWEWEPINHTSAKKLNDLLYLVGPDKFLQNRYQWLSNDVKSLFNAEERLLLDTEQNKIDSYFKKKEKEMIIVSDFFRKEDGSFYEVGVVQAENYISELGNHLCHKFEEIDFVTMIQFTKNKVSYRAKKDSVDLGKIVEPMGGGGHPKAAGSTLQPLGMNFVAKALQKTWE